MVKGFLARKYMTGYKNKEDASPDHFHLTLLPRLQKIFVFNVSTINMYINIFFNKLIYIQYYFLSVLSIFYRLVFLRSIFTLRILHWAALRVTITILQAFELI